MCLTIYLLKDIVWFYVSRVQLFVTPRTATHQAPLSSTISWSLLRFMSIESVMLSNHLIHRLHFLLLLSLFPSIKVFSNESTLCIRWPKYQSFRFSKRLSNEYLGLISFRFDWIDLRAVPGTLKSLLQHHNLKASVVLALSLPYGPTFTYIHGYWKNHRFDQTDLCWQSNVSAF